VVGVLLAVVLLFQKTLEQKCDEIGERVEFSVESDVLISKLDAVSDIVVGLVVDQRVQRISGVVTRLDLHGNEGVCVPHEEIHFKRTFVVLVEEKGITLLDQHISHHVFVYSAFVGVEVLVEAQILLRFLVQGCNKKSRVPIINLEIVRIIIPLEGKLGLLHTIANAYDACVVQPIHRAHVLAASCTALDLGNLKFFVLLAEENGDLSVNAQNLSLVKTACILGNVLFIIQKDLPLEPEGSAVILVFDKRIHDGRHTAEDHVLSEIFQHDVVFDVGEGSERDHVPVQILDLLGLVALRPQKFLEIHGVHFVVFLVANAVGFDLAVIDSHHRAGADDVIAAVGTEGFQGGGAVDALLQLVKKDEGFPGDEFQIGIFEGDILQNRIHLEAVVENILILLLQNKVDLDDMGIVVFCEMTDGFCFLT